MIGKSPGAVVCAHCRKADAVRDCPLCLRTVCASCARNWATCSVPHGIELRLGTARRLRDVDRDGRYGLVTAWNGRFSLVDLHEATWLRWAVHLPASRKGVRRAAGGIGVPPYPRILAGPRLLHPTYFVSETSSGQYHTGYLGLELVGFAKYNPQLMSGEEPITRVTLDYREQFAAAPRRDEKVDLVDLERRTSTPVEPLAHRVIQAVALDGTDRVLCTGTYGRVHLDRFDRTGELACLGDIPVPDADVAWVGVASRTVAVATLRGSRSTLRVYRLDRDLAPDPDPVYRFPKREARSAGYSRAYGGPVSMVAALSPDGRFVALVDRKRGGIDVHDTQTWGIQRLGGHTDTINYVRFTARTRHLLSADYDNRVLIRPRHGDRFVSHTRRLRLSSRR